VFWIAAAAGTASAFASRRCFWVKLSSEGGGAKRTDGVEFCFLNATRRRRNAHPRFPCMLSILDPGESQLIVAKLSFDESVTF